MESVRACLGDEWESLGKMFFAEEADFMAYLHGHDEHENSFSYGTSSTFWLIDEANANIVGDRGVSESTLLHFSDTYLPYISQETSNGSGCNGIFYPSLTHENQYFDDSESHIHEGTNNAVGSMGFSAMDSGIYLSLPSFHAATVMEEIPCMKEEMSDKLENADDRLETSTNTGKEVQLKRKIDFPEMLSGAEEKRNAFPETPKKKTWASRDAPQGKKQATSKKNQKLTLNGNDEKEANVGTNGQSTSCFSSDGDSNASRELNVGAVSDSKGSVPLKSNSKTRATRGAATGPQSLYARRRREKINERLRILQNLVPNGTKESKSLIVWKDVIWDNDQGRMRVDITTMLEEAVDYVKFLQQQIKLLSSDELWMYAPIAYNGMDIGLYRQISPTL